MARDAIWKGFISFGLVEIPVELVTAEVSHELSFKLFDRRDRAPVGNKRINKVTGEDVPWSEVVKGYEYSDGEYVLLAEQELKAANPEATQTIEILDFVDAADVHPAYFGKPYYLRPSRKRGHKAYCLLHETLQRTGRIGIARVVIRTRQHLAALTTATARCSSACCATRTSCARRRRRACRRTARSVPPSRSWPWPSGSSTTCPAPGGPRSTRTTTARTCSR
jgi:Ku protein